MLSCAGIDCCIRDVDFIELLMDHSTLNFPPSAAALSSRARRSRRMCSSHRSSTTPPLMPPKTRRMLSALPVSFLLLPLTGACMTFIR
jgi:hypothetical protein